MMGKLISLWKRNRVLVSAFLVMAALTVFFAVRSIFFALYWQDPAHWRQPIESWMTIGYVAHSYQVNPKDVEQGLALNVAPRSHRTIGQIAADNNIPFDEVKTRLDAVLKTLDAAKDGSKSQNK